ncbi:MAG: SDR family oxidoreductase [Woeseiaceae bacterium]|nr:SDR family oxidoreductase [Woeseiaceae bacterium]NIP20592.1 SDR family oxidoreductase [Woeseiaceae bacterium]NIS89385.1 SDR family oxidoreductase [Woeseiaceae bacterium]
MARTVLISGGASGIGRWIAKSFLDTGDNVHVCDSSQAMIDEFLGMYPGAGATLADITNPADVGRVFDDLISRHSRLDILVNNAGISGPIARVDDVDPDDWDHCIAVNLNGTFYMTRRAVPMLRNSENGSIVNIASTAGLFGVPLRSPYAASKWAMVGLTKTWAMELGPDNIRVNAVCPGCVSGPRIEAVIEKDARERNVSADTVRDVYLRQSSMRTFVSADEIAEAVQFLTSESAGKVSGQTIAVDGHTETLSNWLD